MNIISTIGDFINKIKIKTNEVAIKSGFKIRKGKIKPETFVSTLTIGQLELHEITLDTLAGKCEEYQEELGITRQALFQRMETGAELLKHIYNQVFADMASKGMTVEIAEVLKQFKDIKITDGTTISLPDKLKDYYKGLGGKNATSAIKIQATYSVFKNELVGLDDFSATKNDVTYNEKTLETIEAGELYIKDLGYYDANYFEEVSERQAFFISRIKKNCVLYKKKHGAFKEVDIAKLLKKSETQIDEKFFIKQSSGDMYGVRVTGLRLPQKISDEKKRKTYKASKSKGKQLTEKEIQMLDWFIVITNVPEDMLTVKTIGELYRLRWHIELIFKALKSSFDFDKFGKAGSYYFKCLLYGRLIVVLFTMRIYSICKVIKFNESGYLVSVQKFIRNFRNNIKPLTQALLEPKEKNLEKLEYVILKIAKRSLFDKRKRKTIEEKLMGHDLPECVLFMLVSGGF